MSRRLVAVLVLFAVVFVLAGCSQSGGGASTSQDKAAPAPAPEPASDKKPEEPKYTSWVVYINDEDSFSQGSVTYKIALNFTATNPTAGIAGTYRGTATASTSTNGTVNGQPLNAQAIAQSGNLEFTLDDATAGGALATLTADSAGYSGSGTITMKTSGSGTIGQAGGSFGNTSSQKIDISVNGSEVTLKVGISGHTYTFHGTISGK